MLRPYQERLATRLYESDSCLVDVPMGAGKTLAAATAIQELLDDGVIAHALIVAPLRVARITWPDEIEKWPGLTFSYGVVTGSAQQREQVLREDHQVFLINYENLPWLLEQNPDFDLLVFDEVTKLKNAGGVRSKAQNRYQKRRKLLRWGMTGTLVTQGVCDLHGICKAVDGGKHLGASKTAFMQRYYQPRFPGCPGWDVVPKAGAQEDVLDRIADMVTQITDDEYTSQLPELVQVPVRVELPEEARGVYAEMERELITLLVDSGQVVIAANGGVAVNKLQQLANGFIYTDLGAEYVHCAKLDAFDDLMAEAAGENVMVMFRYREELAMLQARVPGPNLGDSDDDMVAKWNAGDIPVMYAHPASCGHGLNLQAGGHRMVWFSAPWSLEEYLQSIARLLRSGQTRPVISHVMQVDGTVDYDVADTLQRKGDVLSAVREGLMIRSIGGVK